MFFLLLILYHQGATAQNRLPCADYKIDRAALLKALEYERNNQNSKQVGGFLARVFFHIITDDDGTNASATVSQVNSEYATLVSDYAGDGICYINAGYDIVRSTKLNSQFNAITDDPALFNPYRVPNCINVFFPTQILGTNPSCTTNCGIGRNEFCHTQHFLFGCKGHFRYAYYIAGSRKKLIAAIFETYNGQANIDGSNSTTAADLIGDTPADPYAYNSLGNNCYAASGCVYTGTCTDPKGNPNYTPPYTNKKYYWM